MVFFSEILVITFLLILTSVILQYRRRLKHPPGPFGFPILGMLPFQIFDIIFPRFSYGVTDAENFKKYKERYGPIWSVEYGKQRLVTLSASELIKEAFIENGELFSGRPTNEAYKLISHGRGLIFTDGEMWRGHRQLAIRALKDLGMGRKTLESRIIEEAEELLSYLESCSAHPVKIVDALSKGMTNVINRLVFDGRNEYDDPEFETYAKNLRLFAHSDRDARNAGLVPGLFKTRIMKKLYPETYRYILGTEYCYRFIRNKCDTKMKSYSNDIPPDCVFDYFQSFRFSDSSPISRDEQYKEIIQSLYDLFNAGVDTTSNLLSFCCLMLGRYEDVQKDLRNEIKASIVDCFQINMNVRKSCPKILSFIDEVHRFCCVVPKVHRRVLQDCTFHGYRLHPDDIIFGDFANVFSDPSIFNNPNLFNPYRFMDESRTKYSPSQYLIPFGIGKRSCLGESIANMETFLFLGRIIHRFRISLPEEVAENFDIVLKGHSGMVHGPLTHNIRIDIL